MIEWGSAVTLLPWLLVLGLAVVVASGTAVIRRTAPSREAAAAAARRHALGTSVTAIVVAGFATLGCAVTCLSLLSGPGVFGRTLLLMPLVAGIAHTIVILFGELTWPRPQGDVRRARLARRSLLDAAPRRLVRLAATTLAVLVVILVTGALTADHTGRRIAVALPGGEVTASPFPGSHYGGPVAVGLVVLVLATGVALRVVADRPAVTTEDPRIEAALRRASAHRVLRGATAAGLALAAGLLFMVGTSLRSVGSITGIAATAGLGAVGRVAVIAAVAAVLTAVVVACLPAPTVPADAVPTS